MVTTQSFRLRGKSDIKDIVCNQVEEESVIVWEDIEQVFPGVSYIANGNTVVSMMRDSNRNRVTPQCIKQYPGAVLDVILSTTSGGSPSEISTGTSSASQTDERPSAPTITLDLEAEIVQRVASSLTPKTQAQLRVTSNGCDLITQAVKDGQLDPSNLVGRLFQELKTEMAKNMELSTRVVELVKKKEPQTQSLDQMALIRRRIQTLLTQSYELHNNPVPRLFIVLPLVDPSSWDSKDPFSNTFRLYFLCDCGEHTMSTSSGNSHHIHLAKHEGYNITRPKEFFQEYGLYVFTVLQMLKFGISVRGIAVPTLSHLINPAAICQASTDLQFLADTIESGMDLIMEHLERVYVDKGVAGVLENQMNNQASEGADLRQLESFLKKREDENGAFGNLYRTVTSEGHARWICISHYRENYHEKAVNALCGAVKELKGSYNENLGRVNVQLRSRDDADQFNLALGKMKAIYDLGVRFASDTTQGDFKRLRDTLARCNVGMLKLYMSCKDDLANDNVDLSKKYDPILDIMRHPSLQFVKIEVAKCFFKHSNLQTCDKDFSNLRHLEIYWRSDNLDIPGFKSLIAKAPNLSSLVLNGIPTSLILQLYSAIAEHQTYSINFNYQFLKILPPTDKAQLSETALKDTADLLRSLGDRIEIVELSEKELDEATVAAFAKGTENGSCLKELTLKNVGRYLGKQSVQDLADLVARSELHRLDIHLGNEEERVQILESIQWKHIRVLKIYMNEGNHGMSPLKAVVDGIESLSGRAELEHFHLSYEAPRRLLSIAQEQLLRSLVDSTSLKQLRLDVLMTPDQMLSLLKSVNLSRLEKLTLLCEDFKSTDVDSVLDRLQCATSLRNMWLLNCDVTHEQMERTEAQGTVLTTGYSALSFHSSHNPCSPSFRRT